MTSDEQSSNPDISVALSGGGFRAVAFHLGCLRALHELGMLNRISVLSTVSGGSIIGAMYAYSNDDFPEFEKRVRALLQRGLIKPMVATALKTPEGIKAITCFVLLLTASAWRLVSRRSSKSSRRRLRRFASRTTLLERTLHRELFPNMKVSYPTRTGLQVIINATELQTGSAFRFGNLESGSWRMGKIADNDVTLAKAVAASAAYPLFLPALDERLKLTDRNGSTNTRTAALADGGVYDNLGVTCLWPDRDAKVSYNVAKCDYIICCNAGRGLRNDSTPRFFKSRMELAFTATFDRVQNASMNLLHRLEAEGRLKGFLLPFLGQRDDRVPDPPPELVPRESIIDYPTNLSAMKPVDIDRIVRRGEQLTRHLAKHYWSRLLSGGEPAVGS